ncbi:MAG: glycosyltransferase family 2 protein [Chitinivibrionia bacterium]|nr:glycosyltransferase family 2 protein [Chitinivibrionia bacterium]
MKVLFFISISAIVYTYLGYPLIIYIWGSIARRTVRKKYAPVPLSVVLAVRNEEGKIRDRLANLLDQEYPADLVEIIVVSDGSTDRTREIASEHPDTRIRAIDTGSPAGKAAAINAGVAAASHGIVVFADARQVFSRNVFAELASLFHDPEVGAASGELVFSSKSGGGEREGVGLYWRYEKMIRRKESDVDSVVGASGSIYAIRRELFAPLPPGTILDDFLLPMRIVLAGRRVVFTRDARAYDRLSETSSQEFSRKVRTLAGNFQAIRFEKALLNPLKNRIFFQMASHKLARLAAPYFCLAALASNAMLSGAPYRILLAAQLLFYASVLLKFTGLRRTPAWGMIGIAWTFVLLNAAAVAGMWVFATGREGGVWKKD